MLEAKGREERGALAEVHRMGPEGLMRSSFCITAKHFRDPFGYFVSLFHCVLCFGCEKVREKEIEREGFSKLRIWEFFRVFLIYSFVCSH